MHTSLDRHNAADDARHLTSLAAVQSSETYKKAAEQLQEILGDVYVIDYAQQAPKEEKLDREGLSALRHMGNILR